MLNASHLLQNENAQMYVVLWDQVDKMNHSI